MPKDKIKYSDEYRAIEAYSVFIQKMRPTRSYSKEEIERDLWRPEIYKDFLKLCIEYDQSEDLEHFRRGLLMVLKSIGITKVSEATGISRVSLYRMLSGKGNPELKSLLWVLSFLDMRLWVVDEWFVWSGKPLTRLRAEKPSEVVVSHGRRIAKKRSSDKA